MSWTPVHPTWAAPSRAQLEDLHWLAYRTGADASSRWADGIAATVAWVRGGRGAPVTDRGDAQVTASLARAEWWAAAAAADPDLPPPPLEAKCAELGVPYASPRAVHPTWAKGAWDTLAWLLAVPGVRGEREPPLPLPVRHIDGTIPTEVELYDVALAAAPHRFRSPEQRRELQARCETNARRYRDLAALVDDTRERLRAAS